MNAPSARHDLVQTTLAVVFLLALIGGTFWILRPLMPPLLWSTAIAISTWPLLLGLEKWLGGRRLLAGSILTLLLTFLLLLPIFLAVVGIVNNAEQIISWVQSLGTRTPPPPPPWLERVPLVGERAAALWRETIDTGGRDVMARLAPYADPVVTWLLGRLGGAGRVLFHFALTLVGVVFLYRHGETVGRRVTRFARRLGGEHGVNTVILATQATRSVALGVILTAIVQALLAAVGLLVARVPSVGLLTVLMMLTGLAQLGPMPVLLPAVIWLYATGDMVWGTVLLVWSGFVGVIDNVLRPVLIRRGADLPMMLVFVGVLGGLIAFGVVGLFIGPVVLAVVYRLSAAWIALDEPGEVLGEDQIRTPASPARSEPHP